MAKSFQKSLEEIDEDRREVIERILEIDHFHSPMLPGLHEDIVKALGFLAKGCSPGAIMKWVGEQWMIWGAVDRMNDWARKVVEEMKKAELQRRQMEAENQPELWLGSDI